MLEYSMFIYTVHVWTDQLWIFTYHRVSSIDTTDTIGGVIPFRYNHFIKFIRRLYPNENGRNERFCLSWILINGPVGQ